MSNVSPRPVVCPTCRHEWVARLFDSLNADTLGVQVDDILAGTFEAQPCPGCNAMLRPEHTMVLSELATRTWIVMHPPADRTRYARIERGVELGIQRNVEAGPPGVADIMRGARPRLVFGQRMLTEAVRVLRARISPPILECAKLLAVRRNLGDFMRHGPSQLVFEDIDERGELRCSIDDLETTQPIGELRLPADAIAEVWAGQAAFAAQYPALFSQPYVSACRYLYDNQ